MATKERLTLWRRFGDGIPVYLARHYWWAYLWRPGVWFFDHQLVINAILFGQYRRLLKQVLRCLASRPPGRLLQLTCVYGQLSPSIVRDIEENAVYICDVAPMQLEVVRRKLTNAGHDLACLARMNAEALAFRDESFSTFTVWMCIRQGHAECIRFMNRCKHIMRKQEVAMSLSFFEDGRHGGLMAVGIVHLLIFWILSILGTGALWKYLNGGDLAAERKSGKKTPLTLLQERYVRGEIQRDEYEEKKRDLGV